MRKIQSSPHIKKGKWGVNEGGGHQFNPDHRLNMVDIFLKYTLDVVGPAAALASAIAAWSSLKSLKINSNPVLKISVQAGGIESDKFFILLINIGSGLARRIKVSIPSQNRFDICEISNLQVNEESSPIKIVEHGSLFYDDPRVIVEYCNIFGDRIKTTGKVRIDTSRGKPQASTGVDWDVAIENWLISRIKCLLKLKD